MRIDPALRALRGDDTPQRLAQDRLFAARDAWRARPQWQALADAFSAYGEGAALADCRALADVFGDAAHADALARDFVGHFLPAVADAPLGLFPLRHAQNGSFSTLLLASHGRAVLLLMVIDGGVLASRPRPEAVGFVAGERHEAVLAGTGHGRRVECRAVLPKCAELAVSQFAIGPGTLLSVDTARATTLVDAVDGALVTLRLQRRGAGALIARDYALADGALVHQAAGDADQSRQELMLSLLGRMGRKDAAPVMAAMACEGAEGMRWQALRECLALDTATGFGALATIARDAADPLAAPAGALRAQLIEMHPSLALLEEREAICPA